jgi:hypothetical protein
MSEPCVLLRVAIVIEEKKKEVHQVRAPKYYVQNRATIKYEMPVEPTQRNYQ